MPRPRAFTDTEATDLRRQYEAGATVFDLSSQTGRSSAAVTAAIERAGGMIRRQGRPRAGMPEGWADWTTEQRRVWKTYGLPPEEYARLKERAGGRCEACGRKQPLEVEHNHSSGHIRGLVCHSCNVKISHLERWTGEHPEHWSGIVAFLKERDPSHS